MQFDWSNQNYSRLPVREKSKISFIDISEILYLQCDGYLTTIYLVNKENISISKLLKHFEEELWQYGFRRANHNTLVNTQHIDAIKTSNKQWIIHIKDVEMKISRRKFYLFRTLLE